MPSIHPNLIEERKRERKEKEEKPRSALPCPASPTPAPLCSDDASRRQRAVVKRNETKRQCPMLPKV